MCFDLLLFLETSLYTLVARTCPKLSWLINCTAYRLWTEHMRSYLTLLLTHLNKGTPVISVCREVKKNISDSWPSWPNDFTSHLAEGYTVFHLLTSEIRVKDSCFVCVHSIRDNFALIVPPFAHWSPAFQACDAMWCLKSDQCWEALLAKSAHWFNDDKLGVHDACTG